MQRSRSAPIVCWRGVFDMVRDVVRDRARDEIVEAMMKRGVFPLPFYSMADDGWQGTGHEFCVVNGR